MAGLITHMVVAREVNKRLPAGTIKDMGMFYMGNLAPDAIHVREGYIRALKKRTHFRDDIMDRDFIKDENRALFLSRLTDFINEYKDVDAELIDLYRGYAVHVLVDELYTVTIREDFCKTLEKLDIDQGDPRFFEYVITDMKRNDYLLVKNYDGIDEIRTILEDAKIYPVTDYLYEDEIRTCRDWLLNHYLYEEHELIQPVYMKYEETLEFIQMAADNIVKRMTEDKVIPRMF